MKLSNCEKMRLTLVGVVAVIMLSVVNAWGAYFHDDFNRPDGEVGNGWSIWKAGGIEARIVDNEVLFAGEQRWDWVRSGIYRPVEGETRFSFDFKADDNFSVHIQLWDNQNTRLVDFYAWPGGRICYYKNGNVPFPDSPRITDQYHNLVVEQEGLDFTLTLDGEVIGTYTSNNMINIDEVLLGVDAAGGTVGSLHIDNFKMEIPEDDKPIPEDGARAPLFTFGEPTNLGPTVNSSAMEGIGTISSDGLELYFWDCYFLRPGGCGGWDIWVTKRSGVSDPWGEPANLGSLVNTEYDDAKPSISADGLTLYFCSNRPGGYGGLDLWMSTRATTTDDWGAPVNLGEPINSEADEAFPCVSQDGLELYFDSGRPGGYGDWDLWLAKRATTNEPWGEPVNLGEGINTPLYDSSPYLSPDGRLLLFHGYRPGGPSVLNMWVSTRKSTSDAWSPSTPLPVPPNSRYMDGIAVISADGFTFYFWSIRRGGSGMGDTWQAPIMPIVDLNGDGIVDDSDRDILMSHMGSDESLCDIGPMPWGDGIVDETDLEILMDSMGQEVDYPARRASLPTPLDQDASDVEQARFLSWWPGSDACEHDVYIGTDSAAVEDADTSNVTGVYRGRQQANEYTLPEDILPGQTFYWRVDEVTADGAMTKGDLWSFSVADYLIVDGMEADDEPLWNIWWDGWVDPNNGGSGVWYPEADIVHGGAQCLFITYDTSITPISQVQHVWELPQDWTRKGVEELVLWVYGDPVNATEPFYVELQDDADKSTMMTHPDSSVVIKNNWQELRFTLADFAGVNLKAIKKMSIGVGDRGDTQPGGFGMLYIDDICLHPVSM